MSRKALSRQTRIAVLTEAGYRCGVPTCGTIITLDIHHIVPVADGGDDDPDNLPPLCPTSHALYERGHIAKESVRHWKRMLTALNHSFDREAMDLLFLRCKDWSEAYYTSDGVTRFASLIVAGLVSAETHPDTPPEILDAARVKRFTNPFLFDQEGEPPECGGGNANEPVVWVVDNRKMGRFVAEELLRRMRIMERRQRDSTWYRTLLFSLSLTTKGKMLVDAWLEGDEMKYVQSLSSDGAAEE